VRRDGDRSEGRSDRVQRRYLNREHGGVFGGKVLMAEVGKRMGERKGLAASKDSAGGLSHVLKTGVNRLIMRILIEVLRRSWERGGHERSKMKVSVRESE